MSIDGCIDKEDVVYIHNGIFLSHKKEWNSAMCRDAGGDLTQTGECTLNMVTEIPWSEAKECLQPPEAGRGKKLILCRREHGLSGTLILLLSSVTRSCPTLCDPMDCACQASLSITNSWSLLKLKVSDAIQPSHPLSCPSPALSLAQNQDLFQWVSSSHQVAKVWELQLQHQSFQWIFRANFL